MISRPDVVEELNLDHGPQAACGHAYSASDNVRFGQWGVKYASAAEVSLQVCGDFEYATFALYFVQVLLARAIGHVLAEDHNARVSFHLHLQAAIDQVNHGGGITG